MRTFFSIAILLVVNAGLYGQIVKSQKLTKGDEVRLIVLSEILKPRLSARNIAKEIFYIAVDDNQDPSPALLEKLSKPQMNLMPDSECFLDRDDGDSVRNVSTGERGVRLRVSKIKWLKPTLAELTGGSYVGNMGSDGCKYIVERKDSEWKIVSVTECYVS